MNLLYYMAVIARIPLGIATALEFTGPLAVAVCSSRRRLDSHLDRAGGARHSDAAADRRSTRHWIPVGVALRTRPPVVGWALYILVGKKAGAQPSAGLYAGPRHGRSAAIVVLPFGVRRRRRMDLLARAPFIPMALRRGGILKRRALRLRNGVAAWVCKPQTYGTLTSLEPAIGALAGLVILHEALPLIQWLAIGLIMSASIGDGADDRAESGGRAGQRAPLTRRRVRRWCRSGLCSGRYPSGLKRPKLPSNCWMMVSSLPWVGVVRSTIATMRPSAWS